MLYDSRSVTEEGDVVTSGVATEMGNDFSVQEASRLKHMETVIQGGQERAFATGAALRAIRDERLHRANFQTFEEYCAQRWEMSRGFAYGLIDAANVRDTLNGMYTVLPDNEFQARPLAKLTPEQQEKAWGRVIDAAKKNSRPISHKLVKQVVDELVEAGKPPVTTTADNVDVEASSSNQFLLGDPIKVLAKIEQAGDLLIISDLPGSTPASASEHLTKLLDAAASALKGSHQIMVFSEFHDSRELVDAAEAAGYETGVGIHWVTDSERSPVSWSAKLTHQTVLHFRKGHGGLVERITNIIDCEGELFKKHPSQKPTVLIRKLVEAATEPGMVVIDPTAGAATTNIACRQIERGCIGIESDPAIHAAGVERLRELDGLSDATTNREGDAS